jgi:radical SAM superfamily enzyme YgiQ (UPF0313 family)
MAKILLLSPPYLDLYGELESAAGKYFPLGLGYIAAYLRRYGQHNVQMYEPEAQGLSALDITNIVKTFSPDVVGLTCSTPNFSRALDLATIVRQQSSAKIVLGGVHASALPEFILETYSDLLDCVVVGEGENTILELVAAFENNSPLEGVDGIVFRTDSGIVTTSPRAYIQDLDILPFPARDLIPHSLFYPNLHNARHRNCLSILTSRGCPYNCTFCASRIVSGKKYRMHSAEYVLDEMTMLKNKYDAKQLLITDDTFTINHIRLEKICRGMIDARLNLEWFCFSQVNVVDREILTMMKKAGCYSIGFGVESANPEILKAMGKPIRPEDAVTAVRVANEVGMKTQAFYVLGMPGETREQMEQTISFAHRVDSTLAFFNMLVPYPGTKDFNDFFADVPLDTINWSDFVAVGEACVLKKSLVPARDIERMIAGANRKYYFRLSKLFSLVSTITTMYEFTNYLKGGLSLFKQIVRWFAKKPSQTAR